MLEGFVDHERRYEQSYAMKFQFAADIGLIAYIAICALITKSF